ncbi:MAG TPA: helix-turn-helix domain-containing protein [Pseudonocardia sp.]|nr:helix-turn-helix domain-containing protein [Pseudonocardia sp.]
MATAPEYCPVSMSAELLTERWNLLIVRELLSGAERFNDIHRGLPGLSRTLLSQRLRQLQRAGLVTALEPGERGTAGYRLTEAGVALRTVLEALGSWGVRWRFPRPSEGQLNPHLLLWRMRSGLVLDRLPVGRTTVQLTFEGAKAHHGWLVLDGANSSVCARDPLFDVDLYASAPSEVWHEWWFGHRSIRGSIQRGEVVVTGRRELADQFPGWFQLSPFAAEVAASTATQPTG